MVVNTPHESRYREINFYLIDKITGEREHFHADITEWWRDYENELTEYIYECAVYNNETGEHVLEMSDANIDYYSDVCKHIGYIKNEFEREYHITVKNGEWVSLCGCDRCNTVFGESIFENGKVITI